MDGKSQWKTALWPQSQREDATIGIRFGRLIHWLLVFTGIILAIGALSIAIFDSLAYSRALREAELWDVQNAKLAVWSIQEPSGLRFNVRAPKDGSPATTYAAIQKWYDEEGRFKDYPQDQSLADLPPVELTTMEERPYGQPTDWATAGRLLFGAVALACMGRALRYLFAGE